MNKDIMILLKNIYLLKHDLFKNKEYVIIEDDYILQVM